MRHILLDEKAVEVKNGVGGRLEVWLRGVFYTYTTDLEYALRVVRKLRYDNRKIAC